MNLRRIIKIKEGIKDSKVRELKEINKQIELLKEKLQSIENMAEEVNNLLRRAYL